MIKTYKAIIEIQQGSCLKLEVNSNQELELDRITPIPFPGNYGYIKNTKAQDGDPLDILILSSQKIPHGITTQFTPLGVLIMSDEKGLDEKIIAKLTNKQDPSMSNINNIQNLAQYTLDSIKLFFETYKNLEKDKLVKIEAFKDKEEAERLINKYHEVQK